MTPMVLDDIMAIQKKNHTIFDIYMCALPLNPPPRTTLSEPL